VVKETAAFHVTVPGDTCSARLTIRYYLPRKSSRTHTKERVLNAVKNMGSMARIDRAEKKIDTPTTSTAHCCLLGYHITPYDTSSGGSQTLGVLLRNMRNLP